MASDMSRIFGTEQDKVNCPFYIKIGACRHGEKCSRQHNKPTESQSCIFMNMYETPFNQYDQYGRPLFDQEAAQVHFEEFFEDIFVELAKFGEIEELNVLSNLGEHLQGNVYVKYRHEEDATKAIEGTRSRFYGGKPITAELSPVTDFREARCKKLVSGSCERGGFCNFIHLREPNRKLVKQLKMWCKQYHKQLDEENGVTRKERPESSGRSSSSSYDRPRYRERDDFRERDRDYRGGDRGGDRDRDYGRDRRDHYRERDRSPPRYRNDDHYSRDRDESPQRGRKRERGYETGETRLPSPKRERRE